MIETFEEHSPDIADSAFVDTRALVQGNVSLGADSSVWPMSVLRGDIHVIQVGERSNIQDGTIVHVTHPGGDQGPDGQPTIIKSDVTIGHQVMLHGCQINEACLIGMSSVILDGAIIDKHCFVGAGSLVPPGKHLESGYLYLGSPVKRVRELRTDEIDLIYERAAYYVELKNRHQRNHASA